MNTYFNEGNTTSTATPVYYSANSTNEIEIWKDIKGFEGKYQISNLGRVKSLNYRQTGKPAILKSITRGKKGETNYQKIDLFNGKSNYKYIHRLVAEHFLERPDESYNEVDHLDTDRTNNRVSNLRWVTHKQNCNNPKTIRNISNVHKKPVYVYSSTGNLIKTYPDIATFLENDIEVNYCNYYKSICRSMTDSGSYTTGNGLTYSFSRL